MTEINITKFDSDRERIYGTDDAATFDGGKEYCRIQSISETIVSRLMPKRGNKTHLVHVIQIYCKFKSKTEYKDGLKGEIHKEATKNFCHKPI